jgi:hypothetical protein
MGRKKRQAPDVEHIGKTIVSIQFEPFDDSDPFAKRADQRELLIGEYLAKKAEMIADAPVGDDGNKRLGASAIEKMNSREVAGMWLRNYGANAWKAYQALMDRNARRQYQKRWPEVGIILRQHCNRALPL